MTEKILFVDDEPAVLEALRRQLYKRFTLATATSGDQALRLLAEEGPFAVAVVDMRMPGMNGIELMTRIKDAYPDTVRLMLTGNADQETAADAVNKGQVFRFLNKPCPAHLLIPSLALALRQYRLQTAEKELLDQTLKGSIDVMAELLSLANPVAFSSGYRIRPLVKDLAAQMALPSPWQYEISALMSQIGCITLPTDILHKRYAGVTLNADEEEMFAQHPQTGEKLVSHIPRLQQVAAIIGRQLHDYQQFASQSCDEEIATGAQILRAAIDYDLLLQQDGDPHQIVKIMQQRPGCYNPEILKLLAQVEPAGAFQECRYLRLSEIVAGMIAEEDVTAKNGTLLIPKGQEITWPMLQSLANFDRHTGIVEPIRVRVRCQQEENYVP